MNPLKIIMLSVFLCGTGCTSKPETVSLFDGSTLDGWRAVYADGSTDIDAAWSVEGGVLVCQGRPIGYIQTETNYESYKLIIEWRFNPDKGAGNSGVLMRITGPDHVWPRSIEAQLHSGNAGDIWNIGNFPMQVADERTHGRRTVKAHDSNEKPLGEWNRYEIMLDGGDLSMVVNGIEQNAATGCEVIPGGIGLQSEGAWIEFRRVELTELR
ncbi:MAG: DUF1080 domain-containing protein [Phycisphaerales bacterium]|nr:DUF1080 domain-containing protein [Phycisphaerales bacterium]